MDYDPPTCPPEDPTELLWVAAESEADSARIDRKEWYGELIGHALDCDLSTESPVSKLWWLLTDDGEKECGREILWALFEVLGYSSHPAERALVDLIEERAFEEAKVQIEKARREAEEDRAISAWESRQSWELLGY